MWMLTKLVTDINYSFRFIATEQPPKRTEKGLKKEGMGCLNIEFRARNRRKDFMILT
jgi:hypothetical protein